MKKLFAVIVITLSLCACSTNRGYDTVYRDVGDLLVDLSDESNYFVAVNGDYFTMENTLCDLLEAGFDLRYSRNTGELVIHGNGVLFSDEQTELSAGCNAVLPLDYNESLSLDVILLNDSDSIMSIDDCKIRSVSISTHSYVAGLDVSFSFLGGIKIGSHKSYVEEVFGECPEISYHNGFESWLYKLDGMERTYFMFSFDTKDYNAYHIQWTNLGY